MSRSDIDRGLFRVAFECIGIGKWRFKLKEFTDHRERLAARRGTMRFGFDELSPDCATSAQRAAFKLVRLPLPSATVFTVHQGAFGPESHNEPGNEYAWDLDVPYGTEIVAIEGGRVIDVFTPAGGSGCDPRFAATARVRCSSPQKTENTSKLERAALDEWRLPPRSGAKEWRGPFR